MKPNHSQMSILGSECYIVDANLEPWRVTGHANTENAMSLNNPTALRRPSCGWFGIYRIGLGCLPGPAIKLSGWWASKRRCRSTPLLRRRRKHIERTRTRVILNICSNANTKCLQKFIHRWNTSRARAYLKLISTSRRNGSSV